MARLRRLAHRVVWANPHKAQPGFEPLAGGMAAALPSIDDFVEGHSVAALAAPGRHAGGHHSDADVAPRDEPPGADGGTRCSSSVSSCARGARRRRPSRSRRSSRCAAAPRARRDHGGAPQRTGDRQRLGRLRRRRDLRAGFFVAVRWDGDAGDVWDQRRRGLLGRSDLRRDPRRAGDPDRRGSGGDARAGDRFASGGRARGAGHDDQWRGRRCPDGRLAGPDFRFAGRSRPRCTRCRGRPRHARPGSDRNAPYGVHGRRMGRTAKCSYSPSPRPLT